MRRNTGGLNPEKASREVGFAHQPRPIFNAMVLLAFALGLFCFSLPGLHNILEPNLFNVLVAPLYFLLFIHLMSLFGVMSAFHPRGDSSLTYITVIFIPCMLLWLAIVWFWVIRAIGERESSAWGGQRSHGWFAPIMLWLLSILWATHIPLSVNFAFHKSGFEKLANRVMAEPSGNI